MADVLLLNAKARDRVGKGAARAARREGLVPGVIYGDKQDPQTISFDFNDLVQHLKTGRFLSTLYDVEVEGMKTRVIPKDVQFDPIKDLPVHVDLLRLGKGAKINVEIQMNFINEEESPGLREGGVLNVVRYTVELHCPADSIPEELIGDLTGLELGDSIHISDVVLPDGVEPVISDRDFTIATIAAPAAEIVEEEEDEEGDELLEGEEGEVEGEEGAEDGGGEAGGDDASE
jgi:large subunit ribosomal protein L25